MIGCDTEDCQNTYNKSEQLDRVQVLELKIIYPENKFW